VHGGVSRNTADRNLCPVELTLSLGEAHDEKVKHAIGSKVVNGNKEK
jgi:hypothetical protein